MDCIQDDLIVRRCCLIFVDERRTDGKTDCHRALQLALGLTAQLRVI